jgi:hypothetical protein
MSRSGLYEDDGDDPLAFGRWRAQVKSATRGKRGQSFLKDMLAALDALADKRLVAGSLVFDGSPEHPYPEEHEDIIVGGDQLMDGRGRTVRVGDVCALGSLGVKRGLDMSKFNQDDPEFIADALGVAHQLAREVIWVNDEDGCGETPEQRFVRVRAWVLNQIKD